MNTLTQESTDYFQSNKSPRFINQKLSPVKEENREYFRKLLYVIIINPYDEEYLLLNKHGYAPYLGLDELLILQKKIELSIEFARKNDIDKLNDQAINDHVNSVVKPQSRLKKEKRTNIYLMIDHNTGYHKIGHSKSLLDREKTLQSEKPTIELVESWEGVLSYEKYLHEKYKDKRVRGEWFDLSESEVSEILELGRVNI